MNRKREDSFLSRCAYGVADIYGGGAFVIIGTFFTVFLTKALGMPPALAGTIPLIGKVWDAVTDPVMGNITDRTHSRFPDVGAAAPGLGGAEVHLLCADVHALLHRLYDRHGAL